jgi:hypothetical protein
LVKYVSQNYSVISQEYIWGLFFFHFLISVGYLLYTLSARSDSVSYYLRTTETGTWLNLYETGTKFVGFVAWPFINVLNLSYYSMMILFSFFGYLGILLFYIIIKENTVSRPFFFKLTVIELVLLLPNLHFWTSSLGKGSLVFLGIGLFVYGLSRINRRIISSLIGAYIIYMIRPHILLALIIAVAIGLFLTNVGIKPLFKWLILIIAVFVFFYLSGSVLKFTDVDSLDITSSSVLSHRASELSRSGSGIDINNYNIFLKLFTFWFRPLFFDGLGILGFIASFENALCLFMAIIVIRYLITNWSEWNGFFRIGVFIFIMGSFILAQVSGNLGIALRQKSQFMPFLFLLYCKAVSLRSKPSI